MFETLAKKFTSLFSSLTQHKKLTADNISDAVREVRLALLDADVNYSVVSTLIKRVKEKALGEAVLKSLTPGQQFIKIVHDELIELMGTEEVPLQLRGYPSVILLCGLQGSGKTTHCAKLAGYLKKKNPNIRLLVAACDLQRPAAVDQLKTLCKKIEVEVFTLEGEKSPLKVASAALDKSKKEGVEVLIVDTAGRLHVDEELMEELQQLKTLLDPHEILLVANSMTGQDAVKIAQEFDQRLTITGTILTMLDGSARAGAAISIREVTKKPLKFEGIGERIEDIQLFNPRSMADRILGMGDVINLAKKVEEHVGEEDRKQLENKIRKASFTYEDYLKQMGMIKKMGSLKSLFKMLPGGMNLGEFEMPEKELTKLEAMILSMTPGEKEERIELVPSRRRRIALGSGTSIDDVNRMVKGFKQLKQVCKSLPQLKQKSKLMEKMSWH